MYAARGKMGGYHRLRSERMRAGLTQQEMAAVLGLSSRNAYCQKESGVRRFSVEEAVRAARRLDSSVEELFFDGCGMDTAANCLKNAKGERM